MHTFENDAVVQPREKQQSSICALREMWKTILSFPQPFVIPSPHIVIPVLTTTNTATHPSQGIAHLFHPLKLFHMSVPSIRFSPRALIVFSVRSSCLLQCGTRPHFIVCRTSPSGVELLGASDDPSAGPSCLRRMTGALERGAMLYLICTFN